MADIEAELAEWGERMFWPKLKVKGRFSTGETAGIPRIRPTPKQVRTKVAAVMKRGPQVMVKITGGGTGMGKISSHFQYISRRGDLDLENERGEKIQGKDELRYLNREWRTSTSGIPQDGDRKYAFNIMLSMPPETSSEIVRDAGRAVAAKEFSNHQYVFALHRPGDDDKTERPHVHLVVRAEGFDGKRLNPRKADLRRWREEFAQALQERGVSALATSRPIHGEMRRAYKGFKKPIEAKGEVWQSADRPLSDAERHHHLQAVAMWGKGAEILARSADKEDRNMAVAIINHVSQYPIAKHAPVLARPERDAQRDPGPSR